jgi:hypothetical protein
MSWDSWSSWHKNKSLPIADWIVWKKFVFFQAFRMLLWNFVNITSSFAAWIFLVHHLHNCFDCGVVFNFQLYCSVTVDINHYSNKISAEVTVVSLRHVISQRKFNLCVFADLIGGDWSTILKYLVLNAKYLLFDGVAWFIFDHLFYLFDKVGAGHFEKIIPFRLDPDLDLQSVLIWPNQCLMLLVICGIHDFLSRRH